MDSQQINNNQKEPQESPANTIKTKAFAALVRRSWCNHESWLHTIEFFTFFFTKYFLCYFRLYLSYSILLCPIGKYIRFSLWRKKREKKRNETYAYNGEKNYPIGNLLTLFFFSCWVCALRLMFKRIERVWFFWQFSFILVCDSVAYSTLCVLSQQFLY